MTALLGSAATGGTRQCSQTCGDHKAVAIAAGKLTIGFTTHWLAFLMFASMAVRSQSSDAISITHVTVVDVVTGGELKDQTVVIKDGHIASVAPSDASSTPEGRTVDAHSEFLIPGLWDMHVHVQDLADLPLYIANGVTGVRVMAGSPDTAGLRAQLATASLSPEIILGSAIVDGNPPVWPGSIVVKKPADARRTVDEIKAGGADFVKVYSHVPRDAYFALADEANKQNIPFVGHLPNGVTAQEASGIGQRSIEHLDGIAVACSRDENSLTNGLRDEPRYLQKARLQADALRSFDPAQCQALFAEFRSNSTWQVPTLTVHRSMSMLNDRHFTSDKRLEYMSHEVKGRWEPGNDLRFRRWTGADYELQRELLTADQRLVGMMFRAGVPLLAGTDAMNPFCFPGFSLHDELALLVESGLTPLAALQAATVRPAEFLGRTSELGSIAAGKRADLILLSADPLADIHNTTRIEAVWRAGSFYERAALNQLLESAKHRSMKGTKLK